MHAGISTTMATLSIPGVISGNAKTHGPDDVLLEAAAYEQEGVPPCRTSRPLKLPRRRSTPLMKRFRVETRRTRQDLGHL